MRVPARHPSLLPSLWLLAAACGSGNTPEHRFVDGFIDRSERVVCRPAPVPSERAAEVADLSAPGDTAVLALYARDRELRLHGPDLEPLRTVRFAAEGPTGVTAPVAASLVDDSIFYVADRSGHRLKRLGLDGRDRGQLRLPFPPQSIRSERGRIVIAPMVIGDEPPWLLYTLRDTLPVPVRIAAERHEDFTVHTLANLLAPALLPDGGLLAAHQLFVPAAYIADAGGRVTRRPLPLPDGARHALGFRPRTPLTDDEIDRSLAAALALAPDPATGDVLYVTRSGERVDGSHGKAIVRVGGDFEYRRSYLLDVNATTLAYLSGPRRSIVTDPEGRWYRCPTP